MLQVPDEIRFISLFGIEYHLPWEGMLVGHSFFLKTTANAKMVMIPTIATPYITGYIQYKTGRAQDN